LLKFGITRPFYAIFVLKDVCVLQLPKCSAKI
jgi:hypothetical protein